MSLTKEQRDALPESDFAVPETLQLPMHDAKHAKLAWDMVDNTKGLTGEQRKRARERILKRAHELGLNTDNWNKLKAMCFAGMAIELPDVKDHPNRTPFTGILTRIDEPSDNPLTGSKGKRVILPRAVAEKALASLLGMGVDFTPGLDGHDPQSKIGLITEATIEGNAIHIAGFFYGADFATEVKNIQANKSQLGFSYEAQARVRSLDDDPLVIENCDFTGAAVLFKNKAAYTTTSLSAKTENLTMSDETAKKFEEMQAQINKLTTQLAEATKEKLHAGNIQHLIKPHAEALRNSAAAMAAAGMGMHPKNGHVAILHNMADNMEAEAALGKMPHVYQNYDFLHGATEKEQDKQDEKPAEPSKEITAIQASLAEISTKLVDLEKAKFLQASAPERKTLSPAMSALLVKAGIAPGSEKLNIKDVDSMLGKTNMSPQQRMTAKLALTEQGRL